MKPRQFEECDRQEGHPTDGESAQLVLRVPVDMFWLEGHFPGDPILPAVVQLAEAMRLIRQRWPDLEGLGKIRRAKFRRTIHPADQLTLQLKRMDGGRRVVFEYSREGEICSSGKLEFRSR